MLVNCLLLNHCSWLPFSSFSVFSFPYISIHAVNFPLSPHLAEHHKFWRTVFSFTLSSIFPFLLRYKNIFISSEIFSCTDWLLRSAYIQDAPCGVLRDGSIVKLWWMLKLLPLSCTTPHLDLWMNWKGEKGLASLPLFCICLCSELFTPQPPWNPGRIKLLGNILWQELKLPLRQKCLSYCDEAVPDHPEMRIVQVTVIWAVK